MVRGGDVSKRCGEHYSVHCVRNGLQTTLRPCSFSAPCALTRARSPKPTSHVSGEIIVLNKKYRAAPIQRARVNSPDLLTRSVQNQHSIFAFPRVVSWKQPDATNAHRVEMRSNLKSLVKEAFGLKLIRSTPSARHTTI